MDRVKTAADVESLTSAPLLPRPSATAHWTPPSSPSAAVPTSPSAVDVDADGARLEVRPSHGDVLDELVELIDGVGGAILASVDGFGLATSASMVDEASHPAMLAAAVGLAHQLVSMAGGQILRQLVIDHDGGLMLVWPIGSNRVLAVLSTPTVDQRRLRAFVRARTPLLDGSTT